MTQQLQAAGEGWLDIANEIIKKKCDVNIQDENGCVTKLNLPRSSASTSLTALLNLWHSQEGECDVNFQDENACV